MQHVVTPEEAGKRVDLVIAHLTGFPRSLVSEAVKRGDVFVDKAIVKGSFALESGQTLDFSLQEREVLVAQAEAIDVPIVYEDDEIIVVNKPAGMVSHPAHGATSGTLANAMLAHAGSLPGEPLRPGLVHRLDRDTSGLLVVAKTAEALTALGKAMQRRFIDRVYLGLVHGVPLHPKGTLDGAIGRDPSNRLKYTITADGKPAVTHYETREVLKNAAELQFTLETGRTHQIRVHMAALGYSIVNDPVYGKTEGRFALPGQALHAWKLSFRHPRTHEDLSFEVSPPPEYLAAKALLS